MKKKTNTYGISDITNGSGFHTTDDECSEILPDNNSLIERVYQMLADDKSSVRIIREIKNDKYNTKISKKQVLKLLYRH
ncbi:MAG: hypothetical protein K2H01_02035 [Ruminococcus sp.]|nr:hypothetical protein [Ruminococcus sp.]